MGAASVGGAMVAAHYDNLKVKELQGRNLSRAHTST